MWTLATLILMVSLITSGGIQVSPEKDGSVTEIKINGTVSVSIKTEGEVTALLLLLTPAGPQQVKVNTNCKTPDDSQDPAKEDRGASVVESSTTRASVYKSKPAKVTLNDIIALRFVGESREVTESGVATTVSPVPSVRNCLDLQAQGEGENGIYVIYPYECCSNRSVAVYCDFETDGGGWTVLQRRGLYATQEDFYRGWQAYVDGFGDLSQEFWLGLNNIHALVNQSAYEIRFDLEDFEGEKRWAKYTHFYVGGADTDYRMEVGGYTGTAEDSFARHNGMPFSTKDHESLNKCASTYKGAWWYAICHDSNLNGQYLQGQHTSYADGVNWRHWKGYYYSLKFTEIKIRPRL
ncbi:techylectin-5A-like [Palaemon carinicauda]|uniref:techylectin-5A-like n=1 Tax=Palaemon carinicauda TaxID=392227 RepID=UPI0035B5ABFA